MLTVVMKVFTESPETLSTTWRKKKYFIGWMKEIFKSFPRWKKRFECHERASVSDRSSEFLNCWLLSVSYHQEKLIVTTVTSPLNNLTAVTLRARWQQDGCKPETTVRDCVSTFESMKPLDAFNKKSGHFPAVFVWTEAGILRQNIMFSKP